MLSCCGCRYYLEVVAHNSLGRLENFSLAVVHPRRRADELGGEVLRKWCLCGLFLVRSHRVDVQIEPVKLKSARLTYSRNDRRTAQRCPFAHPLSTSEDLRDENYIFHQLLYLQHVILTVHPETYISVL